MVSLITFVLLFTFILSYFLMNLQDKENTDYATFQVQHEVGDSFLSSH